MSLCALVCCVDPKISNLVSKEIEAESIIVFDEAHNIDNICIEALSVTLDRKMIQVKRAHNTDNTTKKHQTGKNAILPLDR